MTDVDEPDENTDNSDDLGEHFTEVVELALQGRLFADLGGDRFVNVSDGGALAGEDDNSACVAVYDARALKMSVLSAWNC